ncbi:hypothetical protein [Zunongwangia endophytica]|uniref:Uncharacterized protein n=1 Tax=Zunongwangia endophytica TaxID=1808945 RepID=A0ABV8H8N2_9FLAO|nr:hypothetical protein [Zunongwangia endophytica]MDN3595314.1 hypothetical protein [Zunongwangia endophytica]
MEISEWLNSKSKDYNIGIDLYAGSNIVKSRTLANLKRGQNPRNMAVLIKELRQLSKTRSYSKPQPKPAIEKVVAKTPKPVQVEMERKNQIEQSASAYFQKIKYNELPAVLKVRYRQLKDLFYDMSDLKFVLNDLPTKEVNKALKIILKIEALDEQREMIWRELDHWQDHKTLLPTKTETDFSELSQKDLFLKKANLVNYINKKSKRIENWEEALEKESSKEERLKIGQQINRTQKAVHQHKLDLHKIEGML